MAVAVEADHRMAEVATAAPRAAGADGVATAAAGMVAVAVGFIAVGLALLVVAVEAAAVAGHLHQERVRLALMAVAVAGRMVAWALAIPQRRLTPDAPQQVVAVVRLGFWQSPIAD